MRRQASLRKIGRQAIERTPHQLFLAKPPIKGGRDRETWERRAFGATPAGNPLDLRRWRIPTSTPAPRPITRAPTAFARRWVVVAHQWPESGAPGPRLHGPPPRRASCSRPPPGELLDRGPARRRAPAERTLKSQSGKLARRRIDACDPVAPLYNSTSVNDFQPQFVARRRLYVPMVSQCL